jgi:fructose-1,6-bisphosphatase/inositol monophosphatase family enzyme
MKEQLEHIAETVADSVAALPAGFAGDEEVGMGASGAATSKVDKFAEDIIIDLVKKENMGFNILSEEAGLIDLGGDKVLVVDPVDGTANFHADIPLYSVSLAVGDSKMSDITHGIVRNIVNGDIYYAEKGKGAWLNGHRINTKKFIRQSSIFLAFVGNRTSTATWKVVEFPRRIRSLGCASLEMCLVASGNADGFYFNCEDFEKRMRIVDIAASALILREAGGELYDLNGKVLDMEFSLRDKVNFLALGDKSIKEMVI